jgi:hypothetical protein
LNLLGGSTGGGGAADGSVNLGTSQTSAITMGGGGATVLVKLPANTGGCFTVEQGSDGYIIIDTTTGFEKINFGSGTIDPVMVFEGSGTVTFETNSFRIPNGAFDFDGTNLDLDPTGNVTLDLNAAQVFDVTFPTGESVGVVSINDGTSAYLEMGEISAEKQIVTDVYFGMDEQSAGPSVATPARGYIYTKDVSGVTELFYSDDTGAATQLTPQASASDSYVGTAGENIAAGELVAVEWDAGNSEARVYKCDANDTGVGESNSSGIATTTSNTGTSVTVQLTGESIVIPNGEWDTTFPADTQAGVPVYMSETAGNLTVTIPTGNVTVQQVGTVSIGGTGVAKILINVMAALKKAS